MLERWMPLNLVRVKEKRMEELKITRTLFNLLHRLDVFGEEERAEVSGGLSERIGTVSKGTVLHLFR